MTSRNCSPTGTLTPPLPPFQTRYHNKPRPPTATFPNWRPPFLHHHTRPTVRDHRWAFSSLQKNESQRAPSGNPHPGKVGHEAFDGRRLECRQQHLLHCIVVIHILGGHQALAQPPAAVKPRVKHGSNMVKPSEIGCHVWPVVQNWSKCFDWLKVSWPTEG